MGNNHGKLTGNACQKHIHFCSCVVTGYAPSNVHIDFEVADGTFCNRFDFVEGFPFVITMLDTGEYTEVHVVVSISGISFFCSAAWFLTVKYPFRFTMWTFGDICLFRSERLLSLQCLAYFTARLLSFGQVGTVKL